MRGVHVCMHVCVKPLQGESKASTPSSIMHDHDHRISQPMVTRALVRSTQIRICSINPSLWPVCVYLCMMYA